MLYHCSFQGFCNRPYSREGFCFFPCWAGYQDHSSKHQAQAEPAQGPYVRNRKRHSNQLTMEIVMKYLLGTHHILIWYEPQGSLQISSASQGQRLHCFIAESFHPGEQKGCNQTNSMNLHQQMFLLQSSLNATMGTLSSLLGRQNSN